ncbi:hypothetical protein I8748_23520 [Nostoc sp. CENA67]|uniref:Uncharacterized protein n=1 Tax=Amazonocrinis nigriterrae CENA67 TaxID=2794033 RepID=A0A8J7HX46_9NOST|nr:hypothetical protein [Amazonocrinis nigriterrae]MBH8565115.1 hypothetical protein [Amazonocrinis nigriterrae CENA67]
MLNTNKNWRVKIIRSIFAAVNLAMIVSGLASCAGNEPQQRSLPIEQPKPTLTPTQQPNQPKQQNNDNEKHDDRDNDKDNEDKD